MVLAFLKSFSPNVLDKKALMPTPVPTATAIIRLWIGNARDTARRAYSLILDTKMLSTMLYNACTSIEIIMGRDMVIKSLSTGMFPILFSGCIAFSSVIAS
ncbi:hypothetical protein IMSAG185_01981 [Lachnospiraceae bacterium]|nr:hypothetical protein IMSAG185_01981 [Lachnospiraceae bacterium]